MKIKVGNAPCSWGVIENIAGERSGYKTVLNEIAETGYAGTELGDWGFMPTDPEKLKAELAERNLDMAGSWVNVYLSRNNRCRESLDNCLRAARQLSKIGADSPYINLGDEVYAIPHRTNKAGRIQPEDGMDKDTRKIFTANLNRIRKEVEGETGVAVLFHHHIGTWVETPDEIDRMLNDSTVGICFDSGHCAFGGGDPEATLKKYRERVGAVHFKDCDPETAARSRANNWDARQSIERGIFPELGKGNVNFRALVDCLVAGQYEGWIIVEQDIIPGMGNPKLSAGRNRQFIRNLGI